MNIKKFTEPYIQSLGIQTIFGKFTLLIIVLSLNILVFFIIGLIIKLRFANRIQQIVDTIASKYIPGYDKMISDSKKIINEQLNLNNNPYDSWKCHLIKHELNWKPVFIVNDKEEFLTLFYPSSPDPMTGHVEFIAKKNFDALERIPVETEDAISVLKKYGNGVSGLFSKKAILNNSK